MRLGSLTGTRPRFDDRGPSLRQYSAGKGALENPFVVAYILSQLIRNERSGSARRGWIMPVTHEPWLVALSLLVAILGAYVGLSLAAQLSEAVGVRRRFLLAGAALSLASAIWAMHFVGMLAARLPFPVDYLVLPTLLSFLICVIVVGAAVFAASAGLPTLTRLTLSACLMGAGIVTMHYIS